MLFLAQCLTPGRCIINVCQMNEGVQPPAQGHQQAARPGLPDSKAQLLPWHPLRNLLGTWQRLLQNLGEVSTARGHLLARQETSEHVTGYCPSSVTFQLHKRTYTTPDTTERELLGVCVEGTLLLCHRRHKPKQSGDLNGQCHPASLHHAGSPPPRAQGLRCELQ